jgi:hypothetical protein
MPRETTFAVAVKFDVLMSGYDPSAQIPAEPPSAAPSMRPGHAVPLVHVPSTAKYTNAEAHTLVFVPWPARPCFDAGLSQTLLKPVLKWQRNRELRGRLADDSPLDTVSRTPEAILETLSVHVARSQHAIYLLWLSVGFTWSKRMMRISLVSVAFPPHEALTPIAAFVHSKSECELEEA